MLRKAAQVTGAALIAAVLVTGCGGGKGDKGGKGLIGGQQGSGQTDSGKSAATGGDSGDSTGGSTATSTGGSSTGGTTGGGSTGGTPDGSYVSQSGGQTRSFYFHGSVVGFAPKFGTSCTGSYSAPTVTLTCPDGSTDWNSGKVTVNNGGESVTVRWDASGQEDTFTKLGGSNAGGLPTPPPLS
ncbi:hypothetical protein [Streptomyces palmae]|uniref:Uncharacterized protein n=1 Tax=Streptomyces palmae TaxID=1701085 RepID=A0A4Z0HCT4_9ACTN|nr:hypothetical protein [Streptomyces palmae]TGB15929.1 hypothetical protein E4099_06045 [Streptomyces palmae]